MKHRCAFAFAVCLGLGAVLRGAGPGVPDTPAGRRIQALISAFEAGTPEAIRAFVSRNFSPEALREIPLEQRVERLTGMARQTGPLNFEKLLRGEGPEVSFLARSRKSGGWLQIGMRLDPVPAAAVRGLRFEESEGPDAAREDRKGSDGEVAAAAEALVKKLSAAGEFSCVVLLAKDGKPFFRRACGFADRALSVENRLETKFNLGSINKTFTQLAIAQLAEKGKLSLSPAGALGIAGGTSGVNAVLEIDLDTGYTIVVLSNLDPPSAEKLARTLRQWLGLS